MLIEYTKDGMISKINSESFEGPYYRLTGMFFNCPSLYSFAFDLRNGKDVFTTANYFSVFENCLNLQAFLSDLSHVRVAAQMFKNCRRLTQFEVTNGLNELYYCPEMFSGCTSLTSFNYELPILVKGDGMFSGCKLDKPSVLKIVNSLKGQTDTYGDTGEDDDGVITLGIDSSLTSSEKQEILNALGISSGATSAAFTAKNGRKWKVKIEWN